jgi:ubiquinone/menaquinone biosynthesis C-methylase UbiE/uncharacterized membrane protein YphA (DoxX/SURF4 family)
VGGNVRRLASWALRGLVALVFLAAGGFKLSGHPEAVATFDVLGAGHWLRVLIGLVEVVGGLALLVPPLAGPAALVLATVMVGAIVSHLFVLGPSPAGATIVLVGCLAILWLERAGFDVVRLLRTGKGPMDGWIARAYDRGVQDAFRDVLPEIARDLLPQFQGARRLLDVGCGPGQVTLFIAESLPGTDVTGVDIAPTMIELARGHAAKSPAVDRVRFEVADVAHLPFPDGTFDVVASTGSIKHWPDQRAALRELHRVLVPGGRVLLAEMNRLAPPAAIERQRSRLRHWLFRRIYPRVFEKGLSPDEARALLTASPFGEPTRERALLEGCLWAFEAHREG